MFTCILRKCLGLVLRDGSVVLHQIVVLLGHLIENLVLEHWVVQVVIRNLLAKSESSVHVLVPPFNSVSALVGCPDHIYFAPVVINGVDHSFPVRRVVLLIEVLRLGLL